MEGIGMWTKIIINFFLVFWAYVFAIILAVAILTVWVKSKKEISKE
jgi:uncharacterized membrane protein YqaE (UPF0057 family)